MQFTPEECAALSAIEAARTRMEVGMTDPTNDDRPIRRVSFSPIPITEPAPSGFFLGWPALIMAVASIISLAGCGQSEAAIPAHKEIPAEACPKGSVGQWVDAITVECLRVIA